MLMLLCCIAILASDFKVVNGHVTVKVPKVQPGNDYSLVCKCKLRLIVNRPLLTYILRSVRRLRKFQPAIHYRVMIGILLAHGNDFTRRYMNPKWTGQFADTNTRTRTRFHF
jgi:hypothetical protein